MPKISVVISTCDRKDLLKKTIRSVLNQEEVDFEIVVVNDGELLQIDELNLSQTDSKKVTIVNNEKPYCGVCYSRNQGVLNSKFDIVAFIDDDDYWDPLFLSKTFKIMESKNVDIVAAAFWNVIDGKHSPGKTPPNELNMYDFMERNPGITGSNFIVKKSLYIKVNGFDESLPTSNDIDFVIRIIKEGGEYSRTTERLVYLTQHNGKRLTQMSKRKIQGSLRFYNKYKREMPNNIRKKIKVRTLLKIDKYLKTRNDNSKSYVLRAIYTNPIYATYYVLKNLKGNIF